MTVNFYPFDLAAVTRCRPYLDTQTDRFCDWTVGCSYMWQEHFDSRYAIVEDCLILQATYGDGQVYFSVPLGGGDRTAALTMLECHCADGGIPLQFATVSIEDTVWLTARYGEDTRVEPQPEFYDYLYRYEDLSTFAGRRYSAQRNHINGFCKKWPDWTYEPLTAANTQEAQQFLLQLVARKQETEPLSPMEQSDVAGSLAMLAHLEELGQTGGIIRVENRIVGFSVGEVQGDTLYVHVEKGDTRYAGIYQLLVREYAAHSAAPGLTYINREDDSGDEGLRRSKLSYRPCAILEKNRIIPPVKK